MMENTESILSCITAIIGLITVIISEYKRNISKKSKEEYYYKNLLKPFVKAYINKKEIDAIGFVRKTVKRDDDNIPKYIYYLLEKEDSEIFKVLIYDYSNLYQNEENRWDKILKNISKFLYYILFLMSLIILFFGTYAVTVDAMFIIMKFLQLITGDTAELLTDWGYFLALLVVAIVCLGVFYYINSIIKELNYDRYTIRKTKIEKLVDSSIRTYNKNIEKIVL